MLTSEVLRKGFATIAMLALFTTGGLAQEEIFSLGMQLGPGSRAVALGGAFSSVGGDYTAAFWNPAALRDIRQVQVYGSLSHLARQNDFGLLSNADPFSPTGRKSDENFTRFNDIGVAYPVPTLRGSLVFAFGFQRVRSYDANFDFRTFNYTPDDGVAQSWREIADGSLNVWTLAGGVDVSPNVSLGLGVNFWDGGTDFGSTFLEEDLDDIYTFSEFRVADNINSDISGFNVKLGSLFRVSPLLRFGATISTPVRLKIKEDFSTDIEQLDDGNILNEDQSSLDEGFNEYKIQSPWTFTGGGSVHLANFVVSGDLEYNDWSQIKYNTDPPFTDEVGNPLSQGEANDTIREQYRATTRIRVGGEFTVPRTGLSLRAGYFRDPSVFENADSDEDKQFISAGTGFSVDKQVRIDVAYVHGFWKTFNQGLPETNDIGRYQEDIKVNKLFVSFAFKF